MSSFETSFAKAMAAAAPAAANRYYIVSVWHGTSTERYTERTPDAKQAAQKAAHEHVDMIDKRLAGATGSWKRKLEASRVPNQVEVWESGKMVAKFTGKELVS